MFCIQWEEGWTGTHMIYPPPQKEQARAKIVIAEEIGFSCFCSFGTDFFHTILDKKRASACEIRDQLSWGGGGGGVKL